MTTVSGFSRQNDASLRALDARKSRTRSRSRPRMESSLLSL